MKILKLLALSLLILGGINWLLIGLADINLITVLFGKLMWAVRTIYIIIGVSAIYILANFTRLV